MNFYKGSMILKKFYNMFAKLLVVLIGFVIISIGVSLLLCCKIGTDPVSVFNDGLSVFLNTKFGIAQIVTNSIMLIIVFFLKKSYINIATILSAIVLGPMIDISVIISSQFINETYSLWIKIILCVIGTIFISLGVAIYIAPSIGIGPTDVMSEIMSELLHIQYRYVRMAIDCTFVVCGFLLGGIVGIGTIIAAAGTGPLVQFFRPFANKLTVSTIKLIDRNPTNQND